MEPGAEGGTLHGGGFEITDFSEQYMFKNGRIYTGLTVVEYMLADEGPGDGGLSVQPLPLRLLISKPQAAAAHRAVVSGSHKVCALLPPAGRHCSQRTFHAGESA